MSLTESFGIERTIQYQYFIDPTKRDRITPLRIPSIVPEHSVTLYRVPAYVRTNHHMDRWDLRHPEDCVVTPDRNITYYAVYLFRKNSQMIRKRGETERMITFPVALFPNSSPSLVNYNNEILSEAKGQGFDTYLFQEETTYHEEMNSNHLKEQLRFLPTWRSIIRRGKFLKIESDPQQPNAHLYSGWRKASQTTTWVLTIIQDFTNSNIQPIDDNLFIYPEKYIIIPDSMVWNNGIRAISRPYSPHKHQTIQELFFYQEVDESQAKRSGPASGDLLRAKILEVNGII